MELHTNAIKQLLHADNPSASTRDEALVHLHKLAMAIEEAERTAEEQDSVLEREQQLERLDGFKQQHRFLKSQLASFNIARQKQSFEAFAKNRAELLSARSGTDMDVEAASKKRSQLLGKNDAIQQTRQVTKTLERTRALMKQEMERVNLTKKSIEEDNQNMKNVTERMQDVKTNLGTAKVAVRELDYQEKRDRYLVYGATAFFFAVVAYLVLKRLGMIRLFFAMVSAMVGLVEDDQDSVREEL